MGTHESLFRENFAKMCNAHGCMEWVPNPNIVWKVAKKEGADRSATANGKPDGYILTMGRHYDVELKASGANGLYDMGNPTLPADDSTGPGWRQNQRSYWIKHNLNTGTPYWIGIALWGGGKPYSPWGKYVLMKAETYIDLESWIYTNTGLRVLAYSPETGIGSRKNFSWTSYLREFPHQKNRSVELLWEKGGLRFVDYIPFT